jgi:hypothetical protein
VHDIAWKERQGIDQMRDDDAKYNVAMLGRYNEQQKHRRKRLQTAFPCNRRSRVQYGYGQMVKNEIGRIKRSKSTPNQLHIVYCDKVKGYDRQPTQNLQEIAHFG